MLRTIIASTLILAAIVYFGCNSESPNITSPEKNIEKMTVPFKAVGDGFVNMTTGYCTGSTGLYGRLGHVSGKATHLGKFTGTMKYCVQYTSGSGGFIVNPSNQMSVFTAANGDELNFKITGGTFTVVDTVEINGAQYLKVYTGNGTGIFDGGTGRFEGATGIVGPFISTQYIPLANPMNEGFGDMDVKGTISY